MDYKQALEYINGASWRGSRLGLERITELLSRLGVVSAAETDFKYHDIAAGIGKPAQSGGGHHLKLGWVLVHSVCLTLYLGNDLGKRVVFNLLAVYLHALVEGQIRRDKRHPLPRMLRYSKHRP